MRICKENGSIETIKSVKAVCEKSFSFNGIKRVLIEPIMNKDEKATGVLFSFNTPISPFNNMIDYYVGNLDCSTVESVIDGLLKDGFYDFSNMEFQNVTSLKDVIFDEGKSKPFNSQRVNINSLTSLSAIGCLNFSAPNLDYSSMRMGMYDENVPESLLVADEDDEPFDEESEM